MKGTTQILVAAAALLAVLIVLINPETMGLDVARDGKLVRALALLWILAAMITVVTLEGIRLAQRAQVVFIEPPSTVSDRLSLICTRLC